MITTFDTSRFRQYFIVLVVNLNIMTTGMSFGWPSPVLVKLRNATETPLNQPITEEEGSWIVSLGYLCFIFVFSFTSMLLDSIGRKYCIILACIPKIIISIVFIFAKEAWLLILGRAVIITADIFLYTVVPIYSSEISDKNMRGSLGTLSQVFSSLGIVVTMSVGPFVSYKTFSIVFAVLNLLSSIPVLFLPDSPYFLYSKGRTDEAISIIKYIHGSDEYVREEIKEYAKSMNIDKVNKIKVFMDPIALKTLIISVIFGVSMQLTGFNVVSFYLQTILESTKTNVMPELASVIISLLQLLASFSSPVLAYRFKRKHLLLASLCGTMIGMIGLGTFFYVRENTHESSGFMNYLPLISLILVVYCYSAGIGSLFWIVTAELFDGPARAIGVSISIAFTSLCIFLTTRYFGTVAYAVGPAITYWFFGTMGAISSLFIFCCVPETKGKTFNEIQISLGAKIKPDLDTENIDKDELVTKF